MAEVTASRPTDPAGNGDASVTSAESLASAADTSRTATRDDGGRSRAVRVRLTSIGRVSGDPTLDVIPSDLAASPAAEPGVLAQRHGAVDGDESSATVDVLGASRYRLHADGLATKLVVEQLRPASRGVTLTEVLVDGFRFEIEAEPSRLASLRERATRDRANTATGGALSIPAVIPGRVTAVWVAEGDTVTAGERVLAIEAMKMQNELLAPRDGTIVRIGAAVGATVEIGDVLVVIE